MMTSKNQKQRSGRSLLIYPKFQLTLAAANTLLMGLSTGVVAFQVKRSIDGIKKMGVDAQIPADHPYYRFLDWQMNQMVSYLAVAFVISCVASLFITLFLSHRLAGPIIRLKGFFRNIRESGWNGTNVTFRKGDFFSELPQEINDALHRIKKDESNSEKKAA